MELKELAVEYAESARLCSERAAKLRRQLKRHAAYGRDTCALRSRIFMLDAMARDTAATSKYLENYYKRSDGNGEKKNERPFGEGEGVQELEALCEAMREAGHRRRKAGGRRAGAGTDPKAETDGDHVLP